MDFEDLVSRLGHLADEPAESRVHDRESALDSFLMAAGLTQICDDYLHRGIDTFDKVAAHSRRVKGAPRVLYLLRALTLGVRGLRPSERAVARWSAEMGVVVDGLAATLLAGDQTGAPDLDQALKNQLAVTRSLPTKVLRSVVRFPHCFLSFDQRPADCEHLARLLSMQWASRDRPVLVVGLRSAGSWLGPLCAVSLRSLGFRDVRELTLRPGQAWLRHERSTLAAAQRAGAIAVVVDEPPRSGLQLAQAAGQLEDFGFGRSSIVVAALLFGPVEALSGPIAAYQSVFVPWSDWAVHRHMAPDAVQTTLADLLCGRSVDIPARREPFEIASVVEVTGPEGQAQTWHKRGHLLQVFRVVVSNDDGSVEELRVCVEGVGLGYLGRAAAAIASRLPAYLPAVYGLRGGLLYRAWLDGDRQLSRLDAASDSGVASMIAQYVAARGHELGSVEEMSMRLDDRGAVWELVSVLLADAFGGAKQFVRPLVRRAAKYLLRTDKPSVVDGSMTFDHWFRGDEGEDASPRLVKVDFSQRAFSNQDAYTYDPIFDLASIAADARQDDPAADVLRESLVREYEALSGERVQTARWLLYQLVHYDTRLLGLVSSLSGPNAHQPDGAYIRRVLELDRFSSRACQEYFHAVYFEDLAVPTSGPLCAIDIDWVLETRWRSFPAMSPSSALAVRALSRHGYRPVLATGRSLGELRERCGAYRLAGGVAEYGGVIYDHIADSVTALLSESELAEMEELRAKVGAAPGVHVDPSYESSIRAHAVRGRRVTGLPRETIGEVLEELDLVGKVRVVEAASQTDFVSARIDKAVGLRALSSALDPDAGSSNLLKLAIGDTVEDLPMLRLAQHGVAPANAEAALRKAAESSRIRISRRNCQSAVLESVTQLLGHKPQSCPTCRPLMRRGDENDVLEIALGALDGGVRRRLTQAMHLARALRAA